MLAHRSSSDRSLLAVMALTMLVAWVYVAVRAVHVGLTADEAVSYGILHGHGAFSGTANNQWLNTALMSISQTLFGQSEWALRLPNVVSFGIYAASALTLVAQLRHRAAMGVCFVALVANPFMLEFFGLARGYGISLAFAALALAALLVGPRRVSATRAIQRLALIAVAGTISFYANFSVLNFVLALLVVWAVDVAVACSRGTFALSRRQVAWIGGVGLVTALAMAPGLIHLKNLQEGGQLYYGGHVGFVRDTIGTLVQTWDYVYLFGPVRAWAHDIAWLVALTALLIGAWGARRARSGEWGRLQSAALVGALAVAAALSERLILGSLYPIDRAALSYVLPFAMMLGLALDALADSVVGRGARVAVAGLSAILVVAGTLNVIRVANDTSALTWTFDASARAAIDRVVAIERTIGPPRRRWELFAPFPRNYSLTYYQQRLRLRWLRIVSVPPSTPGGDFYDVPPGTPAETLAGTRLIAILPPDGTELRAGSELSDSPTSGSRARR
jgi:hypothetical protein